MFSMTSSLSTLGGGAGGGFAASFAAAVFAAAAPPLAAKATSTTTMDTDGAELRTKARSPALPSQLPRMATLRGGLERPTHGRGMIRAVPGRMTGNRLLNSRISQPSSNHWAPLLACLCLWWRDVKELRVLKSGETCV